MASFWFHIVLIMAFMVSPLLCFTSKASSSIISSSPALFTTSTSTPHPSSVQALPPDIAPLLPSPGADKTPTDSSIPTIPSNPSPPKPDELVAAGPYSAAFSPFGSVPMSSSAASTDFFWTINMAGFAGLAVFVLVHAVLRV